MKRRMIRKDFTRNKAVNLTILLFIAISAMLLSLTSVLAIHLFGAIDQLMLTSKTPHFMQMHSGDINQKQLEDFAGKTKEVEEFQILSFLGIESDQIIVNGNSLAGSLQDNGFCIQSKQFDYLLNTEGEKVYPQKGEIYVPVFYSKDGLIQEGDKITVNKTLFTVAGFIRDSQMNSALAYSKRFVINEADFKTLEPFGKLEYLIEFRLTNKEKLGSFSTAYSQEQLPANGPTLTWPLFRMVSSISDGIMISLILLVSFIVLFMALFCIRFTLLAKILEDYREIGMMKAIGLPLSDIRNLYLFHYGILAATGSVLGFCTTLIFYQPLLSGIRLNFGESGNGTLAFILGIVCILILCFVILLYVNINLRRFRNISPVEALRFGVSEDLGSVKKLKLSKSRFLGINSFLGMVDVFMHKSLYATMFVVVMLAAFIIIVPQNLYNTLQSDKFIAYMGIADCDLRLDIQQGEQTDYKTGLIETYLQKDKEIKDYTVLTTKTFGIKMEDGTTENIKVELGNYSAFPILCVEGRMPVNEEEIALSFINAKEWEKQIGDEVTLVTEDGERRLSVCGIYSDITNGGKTAKAIFTADSTKTAWSIICVSLKDTSEKMSKHSEYTKLFADAKVSDIGDYVSQTFGPTLKSVHVASFVAVLVAIAVTLLVILLFLKLLVAKDEYNIAVMKAMGYTNRDLKLQFGWRIFSVLVVGIFIGTILAGTFGEQLAAVAISSLGIAKFQFVIHVPVTFFFCPILLFLTALIAILIGTKKIGTVNISQSMKE